MMISCSHLQVVHWFIEWLYNFIGNYIKYNSTNKWLTNATPQYLQLPNSTYECHTVFTRVTQYLPYNNLKCQTIPTNAKQYLQIPHSTYKCHTVFTNATQYLLHSTCKDHTVLKSATLYLQVPNSIVKNATQCLQYLPHSTSKDYSVLTNAT